MSFKEKKDIRKNFRKNFVEAKEEEKYVEFQA